MSRNPKMVICRICNNPISAKAKVCPSCGAKNKKPVYKRGWFIALAAIIALGVIGSIGGGRRSKGEKFSWTDIELGNVLPEPKSHIGRIIINSDNRLSIYIQKTSKDGYKDYLSECQDKGFTIESDKSDTHYSAYNEDGYELSLWYDERDEELSISLDAAMDMDTFQWPASNLVSLLPVPKSTVGSISSETSDRFFVYVGKTSLDDYHDYVDECSANGFSVDYDKGDKYYYADNEDGYHISVKYQGNNVISIEIEKPEKAPETSAPETTPGTDESLSASSSETTPGTTTDLVDGMRPEFKEAMDSYEGFYDEYCAFMKQYSANPTDLTLLGKYIDMLTKLSEMDEKFEAWENTDMNDAELKYYLEVNSRIAAKLLDTAG